MANADGSSNRVMEVHYHAAFCAYFKIFHNKKGLFKKKKESHYSDRIREHFCPLKAPAETRKSPEVSGT